MPRPTFVAYAFAFVMVAVSLYCIARFIAARRWDRENHVAVNVSHVAMGLAMAGMLVPRLNPIPTRVWELTFAAIALWFSWQSVRSILARQVSTPTACGAHGRSHNLIHLVMALAMMYMYLAAVPAGGAAASGLSMSGSSSAAPDLVGVPLVLVIVLFASAVWQVDAMSRYTLRGRALIGGDIVTRESPPAEPGGADVMRDALRGNWRRAVEPDPSSRRWLAPRLEMVCHIAMCVTMGFMLVLML